MLTLDVLSALHPASRSIPGGWICFGPDSPAGFGSAPASVPLWQPAGASGRRAQPEIVLQDTETSIPARTLSEVAGCRRRIGLHCMASGLLL